MRRILPGTHVGSIRLSNLSMLQAASHCMQNRVCWWPIRVKYANAKKTKRFHKIVFVYFESVCN